MSTVDQGVDAAVGVAVSVSTIRVAAVSVARAVGTIFSDAHFRVAGIPGLRGIAAGELSPAESMFGFAAHPASAHVGVFGVNVGRAVRNYRSTVTSRDLISITHLGASPFVFMLVPVETSSNTLAASVLSVGLGLSVDVAASTVVGAGNRVAVRVGATVGAEEAEAASDGRVELHVGVLARCRHGGHGSWFGGRCNDSA